MKEDTEALSGASASPEAHPWYQAQLGPLEYLFFTQGQAEDTGQARVDTLRHAGGPKVSALAQSTPSTDMPGLITNLLSDAADALGVMAGVHPTLAEEGLLAFPGPSEVPSSPDIPRFQELQRSYKDLLTRLRMKGNSKRRTQTSG